MKTHLLGQGIHSALCSLFLLKIYLFSCRVLKKLYGYMLRNFFFLILFCGCFVLSYAISNLGILLAWFGYFRNIKNEKERRNFRRNINIFHAGCRGSLSMWLSGILGLFGWCMVRCWWGVCALLMWGVSVADETCNRMV